MVPLLFITDWVVVKRLDEIAALLRRMVPKSEPPTELGETEAIDAVESDKRPRPSQTSESINKGQR